MTPAPRSNVLALALALLPLAACVNTTINSVPNLRLGYQSYSRVLVIGNFSNLAYRQAAENKTCTEMNAKTTSDCVPSAGVLFPGEPVNAQSLREAVEAVGADAVLVVGATGTGSTQLWVPQTTRTTGSASVIGNTVTGQATTRTYGGYNVAKPWAGFEVVLYSVARDQQAWYANASAGGNAFSSWNDLIDAASAKSVARLIEDGILRSRE